jgi:hypothetical protein
MLRRVMYYKLSDVSEMLIASIIRRHHNIPKHSRLQNLISCLSLFVDTLFHELEDEVSE